MLNFDRTDASEGTGISKTDYFFVRPFFVIIIAFYRKFTFISCLCNSCHDLMQKL